MATLLAINWDKWTALGTLILAATTTMAAGVGAWAARQARRATRIAQAELEGTLRPVLVDVPEESQPDEVRFTNVGRDHNAAVKVGEVYVHPFQFVGSQDYLFFISVPIRNVGPGTAFVSTPHPYVGRGPDMAEAQGAVTTLAVRPGDSARVNFVPNQAGFLQGGRLFATVAYQDAAGGQATRTQLFIKTGQGEDWHVRGIALFREPSERPSSTTTRVATHGIGQPECRLNLRGASDSRAAFAPSSRESR
jgi:hypothetical protein